MDSERLSVVADSSTDAVAVVAGLYDAHVDLVFGYLARRVGYQLARDLVGETFRIALERYSTFDPSHGSHRSWLLGISTNLVRHHWRSEERRLRAFAREAHRAVATNDPLIVVDDHLDATNRLNRVIDAIGQLSPEDRDLLVLLVWEGYTRDEIAEVLGIPAGTVRSRLSRIRAELRAIEGVG